MEKYNLLIKSFEAFPNFVIVDEKCNVVFINESYCRLLGILQSKAVGQPVTSVIPGTKMEEIIKTGRTDVGSIMTLYDHEKGKDVTVVCTRRPLYEKGKIIGAVAVTTFSDISQINALTTQIKALKKQNAEYQKQLEAYGKKSDPLAKIIGNSDSILKAKQMIQSYAPSDLPILITGETGTGKEVFANAIHELSNRRTKPFIKINCAAIPYNLLESELFGYEAGAFTGARSKGKTGLFEAANHGTILLDEIGEMPLELQSKLLRVLQEKEIERIGSTKPVKIDVRVICSTNRSIVQMVKEKKFREDLYYRINTVEIEIPALRERKEDMNQLCWYFMERYNQESGLHTTGIDREVLELFEQYDWPGNVRELKHIIERLCYINPDSSINIEDCDFLITRMEKSHDQSITNQDRRSEEYPRQAASIQPITASIKRQREEMEISLITHALQQANGNKAEAARILKIDRSGLYYKLKKYGLM